MKKSNRGQRQLLLHMKNEGGLSALCCALGVAPGVLSQWANGNTKPNAKSRVMLERELYIEFLSWDEPAPPLVNIEAPEGLCDRFADLVSVYAQKFNRSLDEAQRCVEISILTRGIDDLERSL